MGIVEKISVCFNALKKDSPFEGLILLAFRLWKNCQKLLIPLWICP
jgi:hypothetical protein